MPRVSVVVPVFDAEAHLGECLDSLLGQTLDDVEVVCVDDGSTDGSGRILSERAALDARLRVLGQANAGPGPARNAGMDAARGDIVMFCDADDLLEPDACEVVSAAFARDACDVMVFGFSVFPEGSMHPSLAGQLSPDDAVLDGSDASRVRLLYSSKARPFAARVALSRDFADREGIRWHPDLTLGDDQFFCFRAYPRSRRTTLCSRRLYRYRMEGSSLTHAPQRGEEALLRKMGRHVDCEAAVLDDWESSGLMGFAPERLLSWCLEMVLFDAARLPADARRRFWAGWWGRVAERFPEPVRRGLDGASRACLDDAGHCARGLADGVSALHMARYFARRRGVVASVRRLAYALRHGR